MRKRLIAPKDASAVNPGWLDLDGAAVVEVTSEEKEYPVESALVAGETRGWRAADSGTQTIRLIFDQPQGLTHRARLRRNRNTAHPRVRIAMVSGWGTLVSRDCAPQWNFSPPDSVREVEEYQVDLSDVTVFELVIVPDTSVEDGSRPRSRICTCADRGG